MKKSCKLTGLLVLMLLINGFIPLVSVLAEESYSEEVNEPFEFTEAISEFEETSADDEELLVSEESSLEGASESEPEDLSNPTASESGELNEVESSEELTDSTEVYSDNYTAKPQILDIYFDKTEYKAGETVRLIIDVDTFGKTDLVTFAFVSYEHEGLLDNLNLAEISVLENGVTRIILEDIPKLNLLTTTYGLTDLYIGDKHSNNILNLDNNSAFRNNNYYFEVEGFYDETAQTIPKITDAYIEKNEYTLGEEITLTAIVESNDMENLNVYAEFKGEYNIEAYQEVLMFMTNKKELPNGLIEVTLTGAVPQKVNMEDFYFTSFLISDSGGQYFTSAYERQNQPEETRNIENQMNVNYDYLFENLNFKISD